MRKEILILREKRILYSICIRYAVGDECVWHKLVVTDDIAPIIGLRDN